jgi:capsular polysaccharide biosynthesis protein
MHDGNVIEVSAPPLARVLGKVVSVLAITLALLLIGAGAIVYLWPARYFSKVTMEVRPDWPDPPDAFQPGNSPRAYDPQFIATQFEALEESRILFPVIDRLELTKAYAAPGQTISRQDAYAQLRKSMKLQEVRNTGLIEIGVYDRDPQRAANIANTIAITYQEKRREHSGETLNSILNPLQQELEAQQQELYAAEKAARGIQASNGITDADPSKEDSSLGFSEIGLKSIESLANGTPVEEIKKAKIAEYVAAKAKEFQERHALEEKELAYEKKKMGLSVRPATAVIWEKAEPAASPDNPVAALLQRVWR